jgi:hypothetical protein
MEFTLRNIKNDLNLSSVKMVKMMKWQRGDVPVEPGADQMLVDTNHQLAPFFKLSFEEMEIKKEDKEADYEEDDDEDDEEENAEVKI